MKEKIKAAFLSMKRFEAIEAVKEAIKSGQDPFAILSACREAMDEVGKRFETGEFFLSELIYSAEVFKQVSDILEPRLLDGLDEADSQGVVVFGTPLGDIHDLGKNLVITVMRSQGFTIHDLGVDVPPQKFIDEIQRTEAPILAMSALITPAFVSMAEVISLLKEKGLRERTFVIIGGGVTTEFARKEVGADAQTLDPTEAIRLCREYMKKL
ncbi:MAG: cobalamin-dependent protein [Deltaproteobacteria bacterium]|nr:MAG: cobalamin-dependent protein [Deltaproteobacteria bacterium]